MEFDDGTLVLDKVMKYSLDMICTIDEKGKFLQVSDACKHITGYSNEELTGRYFLDFVHPKDSFNTFKTFQEIIKGLKTTTFENCYVHKSGKTVPISWSAVWSAEENVVFCVARNETERHLANEKIREKEELHQALIKNGSDIMSLLDENGNILYSSGSMFRIFGYTPEEFIGINAYKMVHPDDLAKWQKALTMLLEEGQVTIPEIRCKCANGEWKWIEVTGSNQLQNPAVRAFVLNSRDVTTQVANRQRLQENEQRFKSLFNNNPDMVLYENKQGVVLDVNSAVLTFTGLQKHEIINHFLLDFLSPEAAPSCTRSLKEALNGTSVKFEIVLNWQNKGQKTFEVTKIPVEVNGEIIGVYTIAKDITEASLSHNIIKQQAKKLNTVFESITDAFFTLDKNWNFTYINCEFDRLLHTNRNELIGVSIWEVFPEEVNQTFFRNYHYALASGKVVHFEACFKRSNLWLDVKAIPSEEGLSVFFSNITAKVKSKQELEMLSVVASKTHTGVIIADASGRVEWVNSSFSRITELSPQEIVDKSAIELLTDKRSNNSTFLDIFINTLIDIVQKDRRTNYSVREVPYISKSGRDLWLNQEITPVLDDAGNVQRYIILLTDITAQQRAKQERNNFIEELQLHNQSLQLFTHIVSHNLRAPVANILGLSNLFGHPSADQKTKERIINGLQSSAETLDTIIKDLNHILSIRGNLSKIKIHLDFEKALTEVLQTLEDQVEKENITIESDFTQAESVYTVKGYLNSILFNLVSNAIKYRSRDKEAVIKVSANQEGKYTVLVVADNGIGFEYEKQKNHVFGLYKRFHAHINGKGLGLFLVKTQIEALGGKVEVSSKVGEGSTFKVYFKES
ncbi:PAS domain S-box protein [Pontibacter silvestris]|uniref:histidine kinase n=1 Tax=Pontibacter silvestris TaxID=2305183 RepID=A0ABW4X257_9BACT|nr:PAS domain-containing sensor histidine kinase [Pontibacter silvestris]MCC9137483.1 PAS domain-containing sensor histidine kinase [Pontibacter silvestris]